MDNIKMIEDGLLRLHLEGMAESFVATASLPIQLRPNIETAVQKMIEEEVRHRNDKQTAKLLKAAKLRYKVFVEDIICSTERNLTQATWSEMADCSFIRRGDNLLITGRTGCGKSYIACALGHQACTLGLRTLYLNMNRFTETIKQAKLDGSLNHLLDKLNKNDLLILDDFGLQSIDGDARFALLALLEERYDNKSMIIISQLPLDKWYDYISEVTMADAIMDRLIHSSNHLLLTGESMRNQRHRK